MAQSLISEAKQLAEQKKRDAQAQMKAAEKEARKTGKPTKVPFDQGRADIRAAMQIINREYVHRLLSFLFSFDPLCFITCRYLMVHLAGLL